MLFSDPLAFRPIEVLHWRELCAAGLDRELAEAVNAGDRGALPGDLIRAALATSPCQDIGEYFRSSQWELELSSAFSITAAMEGKLRLDAMQRASTAASSGPVGVRLKHLYSLARKDWAVPLYENGILDAWKHEAWSLGEASVCRAIGSYAPWLAIRHWIAHGRYWSAKHDSSRIMSLHASRVVDRLVIELDRFCELNGWPGFPATASVAFSSRK
ncbi:hypothetical protein KPL74_03325 [Bacillus sp. NP157]|nr:hypothetical protein KPL74_03325 [Bacillus sp. NP157]